MDEAGLAALFRRLGARDPESWARSQSREGIPQLARYVFLRQAWKQVVGQGDATWIDGLRGNGMQVGEAKIAALDRVLASGASGEDLTTVVRLMQQELLFGLCFLLSDPGEFEPGIPDMDWGLFQLDADGQPTVRIDGLHESVIETDPDDPT